MGSESSSLFEEQHGLRDQFSSAYRGFLAATWQSAQALNSINETIVPSAQNLLRESGWWSRCSDVKPREPKLGTNDPRQAVEAGRQLGGIVQIDDAYLGGERNGGKAGRGSENKIPFVFAVGVKTGSGSFTMVPPKNGAQSSGS